ncbi:sugar ABC transporter ATP-binding protein [Pseudonocardia ailaonensis]|uniref:Sugar ABC transporter ATP-binding protein n=1 Tax=Pseudonocardia ailaonensis TaxID=367279 RepID=A0ABN2NA11_9PSEU
MPEEFASVRGIGKTYGAVRALDDVSLSFHEGQVHALLGENGSGKSTLVKLLAGVTEPTAGTVILGGEPIRMSSPHFAMQNGVVTIFQQSQTVPDLTVAENIFLGNERRRFGVIDRGQREAARDILSSLEADIGLDEKVRTLSVAGQQIVAIAKALMMRAKLLILDEPTASLGHLEADQLFRRVERLRERGLAIIYITHRMAEVERLADVVSILKDGRHVTTQPASALTRADTVRLMVGRELEQLFPARSEPRARVVLRARDLRSGDGQVLLEHLDVHEGEVVGFAGLEGSGRATIVRMLGGVERPAAGELKVNDQDVLRASTRDAINRGLAFVPPDRLNDGLISTFTIRASISQAALPLLSRLSVIQSGRERRTASEQARQMRVKARSLNANILTLSGGNQQKVMIARTLAARVRALVMDEPTAGVDVGARGDIYTHLCSMTAEGTAIVVSSSDMVELIGICHRILVVREGRVVEEISAAEATEERIMASQLPVASVHDSHHEE